MRNETLCRNCQHLLVCRYTDAYAEIVERISCIGDENYPGVFDVAAICKQYVKDPLSTLRDAGTYVPDPYITADYKEQETSTYPSGESIPTSAFDKYLKGVL